MASASRCIAFISLAFVVSSTIDHNPRPHIFHVIVDDFGWSNTNYNRDTPSPEVKTPHLDALVAEGIHLMRHYVHATCTPSRVSFLSGRLPMHSGQSGLVGPTKLDGGLPYNITGIAAKLASAGYRTALVGKWDAGMATPTHTPKGRGYETSLNYFGHGNYQWGQIEWGQGGGGKSGRTVEPDPHDPKFLRDLWDTDEPAVALSNRSRDEGVFEEILFRERIAKIINDHDIKTPLFLTYTARVAHYPIQAPIEYQQLPHIAAINMPHRRVYHAMIAFLDDQIANITGMLKAKGMWNNTLMVLSSDNGGYVKPLGPCSKSDPLRGITCMTGEAGANNYPLRGGKYSWFEGGIRANSFVSGGYLPERVRGTKQHGLIHITDWYATYSHLAGVDPADKIGEAAGVPPIDSINVWPLISGASFSSPRTELFVSSDCLIQDEWKLLIGRQQGASWSGHTYPNKSSVNNTIDGYRLNCKPACLYNVGPHGDWTEHTDVASANPERVKAMLARLRELDKSIWNNKTTPYKAACQDKTDVFRTRYFGFYGPWCEIGNVTGHLTRSNLSTEVEYPELSEEEALNLIV